MFSGAFAGCLAGLAVYFSLLPESVVFGVYVYKLETPFVYVFLFSSCTYSFVDFGSPVTTSSYVLLFVE